MSLLTMQVFYWPFLSRFCRDELIPTSGLLVACMDCYSREIWYRIRNELPVLLIVMNCHSRHVVRYRKYSFVSPIEPTVSLTCLDCTERLSMSYPFFHFLQLHSLEHFGRNYLVSILSLFEYPFPDTVPEV